MTFSTRTASELMRAHVESVSGSAARRRPSVWPYVAVIALCVGVWIGAAIQFTGAVADANVEQRFPKAAAPPLAPQREGPETDSRDAVQRAVMAHRNNTRSRRGPLPAVSLPTRRRKRRFQPEK